MEWEELRAYWKENRTTARDASAKRNYAILKASGLDLMPLQQNVLKVEGITFYLVSGKWNHKGEWFSGGANAFLKNFNKEK